MAWSYRKRIKIAPGVHLNISKRGISTSIGPRGASVTIGKNGTYLNTGIPGTGIYQRRKISGPSNSPEPSSFYPSMTDKPMIPPKKSHTGWIVFLLIIGILLLLYGFVSTDPSRRNMCLMLGGVSVFFAIIVAIASSSSDGSGMSKKTSTLLSSARESLDEVTDETVKAILSSFIESTELMSQKSILESSVSKLSKKAERTGNEEIKDQLASAENELSNVIARIEATVFDADADLSEEQLEGFKDISESFDSLSKADKIWEVTSEHASTERKSSAAYNIERQQVSFSFDSFLNIKSRFNIPLLKDAFGNSYFLYPKFIIKTKAAPEFSVIPLSTADIKYSSTRFIETEGVPNDSKVIDRTWMYVNKNGGPDRRYSYNPERKVVAYGDLKIPYLGVTFMISNRENTEQFCQCFSKYRSIVSPTHKTNILIQPQKDVPCSSIKDVTEKYYDDVNRSAININNFITTLSKNNAFCDLVKDTVHMNLNINGKNITEASEALKYLAFADVVRCYKGLGHQIDLDKAESLGLLLYTMQVISPDFEPKFFMLNVIVDTMQSSAQTLLKQFDTSLSSGNSDAFFILECLKEFDKELLGRYVILLYRFASIVAKADNTITDEEAKWLDKIMAFKNSADSDKPQSSAFISKPKLADKKLSGNTPYKELESLIGLESVKQEINSLANYVKIQQIRASKGMKTSPISYHCVFTGNPGTGKTTVARIVAEIYKDLGILNKGHLIETDRSGLVAEYVGQTAVKTNQIIDSALDGVLFIDEAYSLISDSKSDYGKEAIATLLKRMEDDRDRLVVILAGYSNEMKAFIDSNPGLQSRFNRYIEFPDYTADELNSIYGLSAKKYEYSLTEGAKAILKSALEAAVLSKDQNFGNGRFVRNLFEKTIEQQANRLSYEAVISNDILTEIEEEDIRRALPDYLRNTTFHVTPEPTLIDNQNAVEGSPIEVPCTIEEDIEPSHIQPSAILRPEWKPIEASYSKATYDVIAANSDLLVEGVYDIRLKDAIDATLVSEAPISKNLLNKRVLSAVGINRVGPRLYSYMDSLYLKLGLKKTGTDNVFFWNATQTPSEYCEYRPNSDREALDIPPEEVSNAMRFVLDTNPTMRPEDLMREAARVFCFSRLGNNVQTAMLAGLRMAKERGIIIIENEMCSVPLAEDE